MNVSDREQLYIKRGKKVIYLSFGFARHCSAMGAKQVVFQERRLFFCFLGAKKTAVAPKKKLAANRCDSNDFDAKQTSMIFKISFLSP